MHMHVCVCVSVCVAGMLVFVVCVGMWYVKMWLQDTV